MPQPQPGPSGDTGTLLHRVRWWYIATACPFSNSKDLPWPLIIWGRPVTAAGASPAAVSALLQTLTNISQQLLQERVSMSVQLLIIQRAATLDLSFFEDAHSYDILQQAQREATSRPVQMVSSTFGLVRTLITFASMIA